MSNRSKLATICAAVLCAVGTVHALYEVTNEGAWPKSWPKELEVLRKQSRTLEHTTLAIHEIPFKTREQFEAVWPHLLAQKSKGGSIILLNTPYAQLGKDHIKAGVRMLSPLTGTLIGPEGARYRAEAEAAIPDRKFLKIGPPWPEDILSASGVLPEYVIDRGGKWVPYTLKESDNDRYLRRARLDIELIVDGNIVDLNRIPFPADTPIIDKRFKPKAAAKSGN